jgi:hypothetical protein
MAETFVQSFTHLNDKPKADRALEQLKRLASLVKPIMRKHGWRLPVLSEFFPDNPSLLGELLAEPSWCTRVMILTPQVSVSLFHILTGRGNDRNAQM